LAKPFHSMSSQEVAYELKTDLERGLSAAEARRRLNVFGPNKISSYARPGLLSILISQFKDPMVLTLLGAVAIAALMGEVLDAFTIAGIVCLNAALGAIQEFRAEKALEVLENYAPPSAWVVRGGRPMEIPRESIVPGDLISLSPGMRIPADARIVSAAALQVEEAALTGESLPASKSAAESLPERTPLPDRANMVFGGTLVTRGEGAAVVVHTGMDTEMGRIAKLVSSAKSQETPLEAKLESLGKGILVICLGICSFLVVFGIVKGRPFHEMFLTGVSLAVAAVPEGLPAVVTLCFAIGVQRMAKQGCIVRKLEAIETLGSVTVICTDKTGTLTKNRLEITEITLPGDPALGSKDRPGQRRKTPERDHRAAVELLEMALLASDARHAPGADDTLAGEDPTEQAIVLGALQAGIHVETIDRRFPRAQEKPFTPERRMMSAVVETRDGVMVCAKGAPGTIIPACSTQLVRGVEEALSDEERKKWNSWVERAAGRGLRVLAVAGRKCARGEVGPGYSEDSLCLYGLLAMADTLREEGPESVRVAKRAGIRPILVTGDHLRTAETIARQAGILAADGRGVTGDYIDTLSEAELQALLARTSVFARVSPAHKIKIVRSLKRAGEVVAMTGDGVNDAPALKEAAVGVAMGLGGTDVAREASSVVLMDDNFSTIVKAVREGRAIYDNIRKFVRYLLSCNIGEVITMVTATVLGLPMPLTPTELLWMNLVTDGLPALALGMDPPSPDIMERPPRDPAEGVLSRGLLKLIVTRGVYVGVATLLVFISTLRTGDVRLASTMAYATLVTVQLVAAFECRSETKSIAELGLFRNPLLVGASVISWLMLLATIHYPPLVVLFHTVPLSVSQWGLIFMVSVFPELFRAAFSKKG
jgi:Ca2+-transporting ATPase